MITRNCYLVVAPFALIVAVSGAFLKATWGDQCVGPTFVRNHLRTGHSEAAVRSMLPQGLPIEVYPGRTRRWLISQPGNGALFERQHEVNLEFNESGKLFHAYAVWGTDEVVTPIPLKAD